jgi:hypothetical protein
MVQGQIFSKLLYSSMRQMKDCYRLHRARLNLTPVFYSIITSSASDWIAFLASAGPS